METGGFLAENDRGEMGVGDLKIRRCLALSDTAINEDLLESLPWRRFFGSFAHDRKIKVKPKFKSSLISRYS